MNSQTSVVALPTSHAIMGDRMSEPNTRRRLVVIGLIVVALFAGLLTRSVVPAGRRRRGSRGRGAAERRQDRADPRDPRPDPRRQGSGPRGDHAGDVTRHRSPAAHRRDAPEARGQPRDTAPATRPTTSTRRSTTRTTRRSSRSRSCRASATRSPPRWSSTPVTIPMRRSRAATCACTRPTRSPASSSPRTRSGTSAGSTRRSTRRARSTATPTTTSSARTARRSCSSRSCAARPSSSVCRSNNRGLAIGSQVIRKAQPGHDVQLTIDIDAQRIAEESLQQGIDGARQNGKPANAGAVVVLDARTGAVVAMASNPTFDPNRLANGTAPDEWFDKNGLAPALRPGAQRLRARLHVQDDHRGIASSQGTDSRSQRQRDVLRQRLLQVRQQRGPGATQATGRCERLSSISRGRSRCRATSTSTTSATSSGTTTTTLHGETASRRRATRRRSASPVTSPRIPSATGSRTPRSVRLRQGHGRRPRRRPGRPYPDALVQRRPQQGLHPDPTSRTWRRGDSASLAVGQGDVLVTPLQLANAYAAFANGGTLYTPRLASAVLASGVGLPAGKLGDVAALARPADPAHRLADARDPQPGARRPHRRRQRRAKAPRTSRSATTPARRSRGRPGPRRLRTARSTTRRGSSASPTPRTIPPSRSM